MSAKISECSMNRSTGVRRLSSKAGTASALRIRPKAVAASRRIRAVSLTTIAFSHESAFASRCNPATAAAAFRALSDPLVNPALTAARAASPSIRASAQSALIRTLGSLFARFSANTGTDDAPSLASWVIARSETAKRESANRGTSSRPYSKAHLIFSPRGSLIFGAPLRRMR